MAVTTWWHRLIGLLLSRSILTLFTKLNQVLWSDQKLMFCRREISLLFFPWCFVISVCIEAWPQACSSQEVYLYIYDIFMLYLNSEKLISNLICRTFMPIMSLKPKNRSPTYFITNRIFITNYILKQLHSSSLSHFRWPFPQQTLSEQDIVLLLIVLDVVCEKS